MTPEQIQLMAEGLPPQLIGKDHEEVITWLAKEYIALQQQVNAMVAEDVEMKALLRECRLTLDELIKNKPTLAGLLCGSTTLGNLRANLYDFREQPELIAAPDKPIKGIKITEHSGCGYGIQVDMLTVRMKRGDVVVQMSESDFKRLNSERKQGGDHA